MKTIILSTLLAGAIFILSAQTAEFVPNYDESKVPEYTLPELFIFENGSRLTALEQWPDRKKEILQLFENEIYGKAPGWEGGVHARTLFSDTTAFDGLATIEEVLLTLRYQGRKLEMYLLLHIPNSRPKAPLFIGYNFYGNYTTTNDPRVKITDNWVMNNDSFGISDNRANDSLRNIRRNRWPYREIISRGYAVGTIYYGDVDPDFDDGFKNGVHELMKTTIDGGSWGSIAGWAWGLSRAVDYIETDNRIDPDRIAVIGHSRLGKAALWAGATDERFAMVISNNSGCGGAALSKRAFGETVGRINSRFPHWFADNFNKYNNKEGDLPIDQHQLMALIAPRPLYVASATEDQWADPRGEFLSAVEATKIYRFMGLTGLPVTEMPDPEYPVIHGTIGYHIRTGKHDITLYDWQQYMNFADRYWGKF
jgi:hypothetical protein